MRRIRELITYANVMASAALVLSLGGTAYAAIVITGKNVKDSTLTGIDIKNASLGSADLSLSTRTALKGAVGPRGLTGAKGPTGSTGPKGDQGAPGESAAVVTSYATRDTGFITSNNLGTPNPSSRAWYDYNCASVNNGAGPCDDDPGTAGVSEDDNGNQTDVGVGNIPMIAADTMVVALQGMSKQAFETAHTFDSRNNLIVPWSSNVTGFATVSFLHLGVRGTALSIHERLECGLQYANATTPGVFADLGEPQMVSAFGTREIVSMTVVGSANLPAGTYNVRVACSDMDYTSNEDYGWRFIRGNLTAMAARNG